MASFGSGFNDYVNGLRPPRSSLDGIKLTSVRGPRSSPIADADGTPSAGAPWGQSLVSGCKQPGACRDISLGHLCTVPAERPNVHSAAEPSCKCVAGADSGQPAAAPAAGQPSQPLQGVLSGQPGGGGGGQPALSTTELREGSMEWKPSREVLQTFGASKRGSGDIM